MAEFFRFLTSRSVYLVLLVDRLRQGNMYVLEVTKDDFLIVYESCAKMVLSDLNIQDIRLILNVIKDPRLKFDQEVADDNPKRVFYTVKEMVRRETQKRERH
ncbi:unnamed protein product [Hyaloperonospora brassicae]|uniref:Uncharacterized protein n=1 Tax=Hyaloperonospora brassicae TaxID=162125 RepID=A0AAV0SZA4_HYABA|nr:unnamed protein product [Hyaloperonospora brassicae]